MNFQSKPSRHFTSRLIAYIYLISTKFLGCWGNNSASGVGLHQFKRLGDATDNLVYYAEANTTMNWESAVSYCKASGMELASIRTANQKTFLGNTLGADYAGHGFWSALREDITSQGFVWETAPSGKIDPNVMDVWNPSPAGAVNCAIMHAQADKKLKFSVKPCTDAN